MSGDDAPEPEPESKPELGWRAREIERELPGLGLIVMQARIARPGSLNARSPAGVEDRLRELSNRFRGARAVTLRREPVPAAYRAFFRHVGLDPDVVRTPIEAVALDRMLRGGLHSGGLIEDSLLIALVDTGVPVWALDAAAVDGPLGIRTSVEGEPLGRSPRAAEALAGGPAGRGRRLRGAGNAVRRAGRRSRGEGGHGRGDAVRDQGPRCSVAVRGGGAVDVSRGAGAALI